MPYFIAALLMTFTSGDETVFPTSYVDAVEVNHVLAAEGDVRLSQILYMYVGGPQEIVDWTYYDAFSVDRLPTAGHALFATSGGRIFAVHVANPEYWHSVTSVDVERAVSIDQPDHWRRGLTGDPFGRDYYSKWPQWRSPYRYRDPLHQLFRR